MGVQEGGRNANRVSCGRSGAARKGRATWCSHKRTSQAWVAAVGGAPVLAKRADVGQREVDVQMAVRTQSAATRGA